MEISYESIRSVGVTVEGQIRRVPGYAALVGVLRRRMWPRKAHARYCYSVWLRHLVAAREAGLTDGTLAPKFDVVVEVGPGESIGAGLAALLSGAERYVAVDLVRHTLADSMDVFKELLELFECRSPIPDDEEFPDVYPKLRSYGFPDWLATAPGGESRVRRIRRALARSGSEGSEGSCIHYIAPYSQDEVVVPGGADFLFSQAVMEHVDDPEALYLATHGWLKPDGIASHQIDYRCHGKSSRWNGHWTYSDAAWRIVRGGSFKSLNRLTHSDHRELLVACGFDVVAERAHTAATAVLRDELAPRFRTMPADDLTTSTALLQCKKSR